jgi:hypothetical protein
VIVAKRRNFLKVIYVDRRRPNFGDGNVCRQCLEDMTGVESDLVTSRPFFSEMEKGAAAAVDAHTCMRNISIIITANISRQRVTRNSVIYPS